MGAYIRQERQARGWTVRELARRIGAPQEVVYRWEWGKCRPSHRYASRLVNALDCDAVLALALDVGAGEDSDGLAVD